MAHIHSATRPSFGGQSNAQKIAELNTVINDSDYTIVLSVDADFWTDEEDESKKEATHAVLATGATNPGGITYLNPWDGGVTSGDKVTPLQESNMDKVNGYWKIYNNVNRS